MLVSKEIWDKLQTAELAIENGVIPAAWSAVCSAEDEGEDCEVIRARLYDKEGFVTNAMNILTVRVCFKEWNEAQKDDDKEKQTTKLEEYCVIKRRVEPYDVSILEYKIILSSQIQGI